MKTKAAMEKGEMVFIRRMKTKKAKEEEGNGLHKGDEDQSSKGKRGKCSS
ncbi:hypothetical protein [Metabacillus sp. B2-18]|nr:hypothetical protein [Metabacillus sp. B2-18]UGB31392.1 hypothetical protein LPC09_02360 [Metabacillus sp. B2-18]